jgi:hypothetical protein
MRKKQQLNDFIMKKKRSNYKPKEGFTDWGIYTVMFFVVLLPFIGIGILKLISVSIILAFFAGALNRLVREYYDHLSFLEENEKKSYINRVTGEKKNTLNGK